MFRKKRIRWHWVFVLVCCGVGLLLAGCSMFTRKLLYFPTCLPLEQEIPMAARYGFEPWRNDAGDVIGWKHESKTNALLPRVLITHGNGGCAVWRVNYLDNLRTFWPADVYILEYPGYGARAGSPTQTSFFNAADEAMRLLENKTG